MIYEKQDDSTLRVIKPVEIVEETKEYTLDFLLQQELDIIKQRDEFAAARELELVEVRSLITQAEALGIKRSVPIESLEQITIDTRI